MEKTKIIRNPQNKEEEKNGVSIADSREWNLLSIKFFSCMSKMQIESDTAKSMIAWGKIVTAYSEPHRKYHGKKHISRMFHLLLENQNLIPLQMFCVVLVTICFHDYDKCPSVSALKASEILKEAGVKSEYIKMIDRMIHKTDHFNSPHLENMPEKLIICLDLAPLAIKRQDFAKNTKHLWHEYKHQTANSNISNTDKKDDFIAGCYGLFYVLLSKKKVFPIPCFEKKYEIDARRNMKWLMRQKPEFWAEFLVD